MSNETPNLPDDDLVAYLDGELAADRIAEIEQVLRDQPSVRERLAELQNTWHLLDTIPRAQATHSFTRSTLEFVVDDAKKELRKNRKGFPIWPMLTAAPRSTC